MWDEDWNDEVAARLEFLKCRACGGTNPYVCRCAKALWYQKHNAKKLKVLSEDDEAAWRSHVALTCSPSTKYCYKCPELMSVSFCNCAKAAWLEQRKQNKQ